MADPVTVATTAVEGGWTARDWLYLSGVIISSISAVIAFRSARSNLKRDLISQGDSEIKIFELIAKHESDLVNFNVGLLKNKEPQDENYSLHPADNMKLNFLTESVLNSYDIACQRYLDGKVDKGRFKKTYSERIKKICSNALYQPLISANKLHYSALDKVNIEMNDPESSVK
ncbi:hypothetical protein H2Y56_11305 [Pectobacterium aroidearum]|uniref:DUF4760 domain-containing protein n=1 Tax=Pectobacterium aroidearum TaxID=1201031 RepID=A0ABR5ZDV1_9GAMM|nr:MULTISPECIES: hypothetical protein [Pectobacterium]MBA5199905.1 hypothetical protein [Pectobacterium aroidearum]MBA5228103.1 hypothetical protein [Pectobacterium aroidearum]MBA5232697.1 hypothetical protein [Pectobacterium aroidearum]MBA5737627.1 hypothetical protein [Pectobacterium aroidearum]UXK01822.1 hypothetical protein N5056_07665 [Pectobacterium aroidearum]